MFLIYQSEIHSPDGEIQPDFPESTARFADSASQALEALAVNQQNCSITPTYNNTCGSCRNASRAPAPAPAPAAAPGFDPALGMP
ncbi:Os06g0264366 [Oryza sativa Japonica Group]|uniref:Os06g0264366 protein n=1 Tax=Oryza sativa subsp. japonica TaxID=39947 RepID=A0A0N7KLW3_ORYSJ|nr:hypothetical protein EE612_033227 [Oryza sativa]BAS97137.1 Os06g0264366 [Oryza sativa Japonica Group]